MKKIKRNMDSEESREFWESVKKSAKEVESWPDWKRGGMIDIPPKKADNWDDDYKSLSVSLLKNGSLERMINFSKPPDFSRCDGYGSLYYGNASRSDVAYLIDALQYIVKYCTTKEAREKFYNYFPEVIEKLYKE